MSLNPIELNRLGLELEFFEELFLRLHLAGFVKPSCLDLGWARLLLFLSLIIIVLVL